MYTCVYTYTQRKSFMFDTDVTINNSIYYCHLKQILLIAIISHSHTHHVTLIESMIKFFSKTSIKWRKTPSITPCQDRYSLFVAPHGIWMWPWATNLIASSDTNNIVFRSQATWHTDYGKSNSGSMTLHQRNSLSEACSSFSPCLSSKSKMPPYPIEAVLMIAGTTEGF